jgi:uncharacterized protein (TIGR02246 family)
MNTFAMILNYNHKKTVKMRTHWIALVFLGFSLLPSIPGNSQNPDKKQLADIAAIKQAGANLDTAYNRRNAIAFSELFLDDADFQWHTGDLLKNRKEIEEYFTNSFKIMPADYRHITTFQRIRFLRPDFAIGDGTVVIAREGAAENEKPYLNVLFTCVGKKVKSQWRIAAIRLMLIKSE